jgi:polar amino acid transport system substrate-binding protein/arginine/ornithine transport system substrate-binding protein
MLVCSWMFAAVVAAQTPAADKVRIGVEGNYPPFSMMTPDGSLGGFDIEIARALCAHMQAQCELVQQEWDGMIPALKVRKFDAIVASMTITDERRKVVEFTDSYYDVPSRWIAPVDGVTAVDPESLKGKRIIVLRNSPRARYVLDRYKDSDVLQTGSETDVYRELLAGRGDIALGSSVVSGEALLKRPEGRGFRQIGPMVPLGEGVGIAVRKGDFALRDRFNAALKAIRADGSYAKLERRYFDFEISGAAH